MLDMLFCCGVVANMIQVGYFHLAADLFRKIGSSCRGCLAAAAGFRPRSGTAIAGRASKSINRRLARLESYVTSTT